MVSSVNHVWWVDTITGVRMFKYTSHFSWIIYNASILFRVGNFVSFCSSIFLWLHFRRLNNLSLASFYFMFYSLSYLSISSHSCLLMLRILRILTFLMLEYIGCFVSVWLFAMRNHFEMNINIRWKRRRRRKIEPSE